MESSGSTLEEIILHHTRCGSLDLVDRRIIQRLFSEVPLARLKTFLALFSVRVTAGIVHKKAVEMCVNRYYKGSEKSRVEAVKIFRNVRSCMEYMESSVQAEQPEPLNSSQSETDNDDGSVLHTSANLSHISDANKSREDLESPLKPKAKIGEITEDFNISVLPTDIATYSRVVPNKLRDPILNICVKEKNENDTAICSFDTGDMEKFFASPAPTDSLRISCPRLLQNIAEPAFYEVDSCLAHFGFGCTATGSFLPNEVEFDVPLLGDGDMVILTFRTLGSGRKESEHAHPLGLVYAVNEDFKKSDFKKALEPIAPKIWETKLSCYNHPIQLNGAVYGENTLYFKFAERPKDAKYQCRYEGYIFVAKARPIVEIMKRAPLISARHSLRKILNLLTGIGSAGIPPETVTMSTICGVTCKPIRGACKGSHCEHVSVFDGENYLSLQEQCKEPRWKCSVCNDLVFWQSIWRDELMEDLLANLPNCSKLTARLYCGKLIFQGVLILPDSDDENDSD